MPLAEPARFSPKGAKWLRFLAGCIYGDFTGHLSLSSDTKGVAIDYDEPLDATTYHFVSREQPRLVDPLLLDDRSSDKSAEPRKNSFRQELIDRDRGCVVEDSLDMKVCAGCHLLAHAKGSEYISLATKYRSDSREDIDDIDDLRNGLLLQSSLHTYLGLGRMAFLRTPNDILTMNDVHPSPVARPGPFSSTTRVTLHFVVTDKFTDRLGYHGYDLRLPDNEDDLRKFPPSLLLDLIYGASFVACYGNQATIKHIRRQFSHNYYNRDRDSSEDEDEDQDEGDSGNGSGGRGGDSGAETEKEGFVDRKKSKRGFGDDDSTDPMLPTKENAQDYAVGDALDLLLLLRKYYVQRAGPTEERLEKEEQVKRKAESIEKVKGWKVRSESVV